MLEKKSDKKKNDSRSLLKDIKSVPMPREEVLRDYHVIFDKLALLRGQRAADVRLVSRVKHGFAVWKKVAGDLAASLKLEDGYTLLMPTGTVGAVRGLEAKRNSEVDEYVIVKDVENGSIQLVLVENDDHQSIRLKISVLSSIGSRLDNFLCSIEDIESGKFFFVDKTVRTAYINESVGQGQYRITIRSGVVAGSVLVEYGQA